MPEICQKVLIVDDEEEMCQVLCHLLKREGFRTLSAQDGNRAMKMMQTEAPDVLLLDIHMPGIDGMKVLQQVKEQDRDLPVIMITAFAEIHEAVKAMRAGAHDYLAKPFNNHEVIRVVRRALAEHELKLKVKELSNQVQGRSALKEMMGPSDVVSRLISAIDCVAKSNFTVIITGETGSGKELIAKAIHQESHRSHAPFVPVDCGAIPETLLESELFGYEKGAFTGAENKKPGKFEIAQGGTLFLDEISNMPMGSQAKLLRALQEKTLYRLGGTKPIHIDARLIVASNQDLHTAIASGSFRRDLFYRLNEFSINVPPLQERKDDIFYLAQRFLAITNNELGKCVKGFSESAIDTLLSYHWPGNVRQLLAIIRRATLLAEEVITKKHLDIKCLPNSQSACVPKIQGLPWKNRSFKEIMDQNSFAIEREILIQALKYTGGNKAKAARILQIDYKTIHTKVKKFRIPIEGGVYD